MMDVDVDKLLRRLDKHTAALVAAAYSAVEGWRVPVVNFDLYAGTASTDAEHTKTKIASSQVRAPAAPPARPCSDVC